MSKEKKTETKTQGKRKSNFLIIFVCIFLGVAIIFGSTLGIIIGVGEARAVASYGGVQIDGATASYLTSYYKYRYMSALSSAGIDNVRDTERFWNSSNEYTGGKTYGELLQAGAEEYIKGLVAANYLYSQYGGLSAADKQRINNAVNSVLEFKAESSQDKFNEMAEEFGFDYASFRRAVEMLYKASRLSELLWGADGSGLKNSVEDCKAYLNTYTHVKLLFIRTETQLVKEDGKEVEVALSDSQKAERAELIAKIKSEIEGIQTGADVQMSPTAFETYISKHDEGVSARRQTGYYFHQNSAYTAEFSEAFPEVTERALEMEIGQFDMVETSIGACFIYKYEPASGDYLVFDDGTFSDFYSDGAAYMYTKLLENYAAKVTLKDSFFEIDIVATPYNGELVAKFS